MATLKEKLEEMYEQEEWNPSWFVEIGKALEKLEGSADGDEVVDGLSLKKVTEYEGEGWYVWKEDGIWHTDYYDLSTLLPAIWSGEWWKILE